MAKKNRARSRIGQYRNFVGDLNKAIANNKRVKIINRPFMTMADRVNPQTGITPRMAKASTSLALDFTTGTGSVIDRIMRYKEYDLMGSTDTMCGNALDCYADNATIPDQQTDNVVVVVTNDDKLKDELEELLFGVLDVNSNLRKWIRKTCKYGDHIVIFDVNMEGKGIVDFLETRINEMTIDESDIDPKTKKPLLKYIWKQGGIGTTTTANMHPVYGSMQLDKDNVQVISPAELVHFCLDEESDFAPFGKSKLESARYAWKQLRLMEDAMLVYRITRAPERRVFKMEVGNLQDEQMRKFVDDTLTEVRREAIVDPNTGDVNLQFNVANTLEDFILPQRGGFGSSIEVLPGGQNTDAIQDVEYFKSRLRAGLKVPKAFLEYDENLSTARGLAKEDARFAAAISHIQRMAKKELIKACAIHLLAKGYKQDDTLNFELRLTNPSSEEEAARLELLQTKVSIFNSIFSGGEGSIPAMSVDEARRLLFNATDTDIAIYKTGLLKDKRDSYILSQITKNGNFNNIFPTTPEEAAAKKLELGSGGGEEDNGGFGGGGGGGFSGGGGGGADLGGLENLGGEEGETPLEGGEAGAVDANGLPIPGAEGTLPNNVPGQEGVPTEDNGAAGAPVDIAAAERGELPVDLEEEEPNPELQTAEYRTSQGRMGFAHPQVLNADHSHNRKQPPLNDGIVPFKAISPKQQKFVDEVTNTLKKINSGYYRRHSSK